MSMEGREFHVTAPSPYPLWNFHSYGTWGASTSMYKISFNDFKNETACGALQVAIGLNQDASDFIPTQNFDSITFNNVEDDAITYI